MRTNCECGKALYCEKALKELVETRGWLKFILLTRLLPLKRIEGIRPLIAKLPSFASVASC